MVRVRKPHHCSELLDVIQHRCSNITSQCKLEPAASPLVQACGCCVHHFSYTYTHPRTPQSSPSLYPSRSPSRSPSLCDGSPRVTPSRWNVTPAVTTSGLQRSFSEHVQEPSQGPSSWRRSRERRLCGESSSSSSF